MVESTPQLLTVTVTHDIIGITFRAIFSSCMNDKKLTANQNPSECTGCKMADVIVVTVVCKNVATPGQKAVYN